MEILNGFLDAIYGIFTSSGLVSLNWQNYIMIAVSIFLLYLAIKKQYEPLLLLPIAFGMLLVNLYPEIMSPPAVTLVEMAGANDPAAVGHATQQINGTWYYFDEYGVMQTGWIKSGGKWYFLDNSGAMLTKVIFDEGNRSESDGSLICISPYSVVICVD